MPVTLTTEIDSVAYKHSILANGQVSVYIQSEFKNVDMEEMFVPLSKRNDFAGTMISELCVKLSIPLF
ncbi:hypothetical protein RND71_009898 [Anisodus tanguticus]|uniref:Uncharacterized protein n=1 Tax=Anisodus tanguticus TaxID=243964 RepID=A0AAE1SG90_9SOLA|nr:hypothetical protein RND71_009898 [Anisodus tanguticus]